MLIHMWKILSGCFPNDTDIKFCDPSRKSVRAKVPSLCKSGSVRNQSLYDHSFVVQTRRSSSLAYNTSSYAPVDRTCYV